MMKEATPMTIELVTYADSGEQARRPALVKDGGRKWLYVLQLGYPLRLRKVAKSERRYMSDDLTLNRKSGPVPYPLSRAVNKFIRFGRRTTMTKATRRFLKEAAEQAKAKPAQS
jgi:hypothetical protein